MHVKSSCHKDSLFSCIVLEHEKITKQAKQTKNHEKIEYEWNY